MSEVLEEKIAAFAKISKDKRMTRNFAVLSVVSAAVLLVSGCGTTQKRLVASSDVSGARCVPPSPLQDMASSREEFHPTPAEPSPRLDWMSVPSQRMAEALDVLDLVREKHELESAADNQKGRNRLVEVHQFLSDRFSEGSLDVLSSAAETDCEKTRAEHLASALKDARDKAETRRTLIAIIGDAMIGIVAGGLSLAGESTGAGAAAIVGGVVATTFGIAAMNVGPEHEFQHEPNLLRDIWKGVRESQTFPHSVWRFLNQPAGMEATRTRREEMIIDWEMDGRLGEEGSDTRQRRLQLFFGSGGVYRHEDLRARVEMLDLVKTYVNQMSHHLRVFYREVLSRTRPSVAASRSDRNN